MAKRRRRPAAAAVQRTGDATAGAEEVGRADAPAIDPDVARFAARVREQQAAEREEKQAARDTRRRHEEHGRLLAAKDTSAGALKQLRASGRASAEDLAAAEAAYRRALAELLTLESGARPSWAPGGTEDDPAAASPERPTGEVSDAEEGGDPPATGG